jgi:ribosomal protein L21E
LKTDLLCHLQRCFERQTRARVTYHDRVPITPIPRAQTPFTHWVMDCFGPILGNQKIEYPYCLLLCCSATRFPWAHPLRSLTAKSVCDALLELFSFTGVASQCVISSDQGSNFTAQLTREFMKRLGVSPRFNTPGHPQASGLFERLVQSTKNIVSKLARNSPRSWHKYVNCAMWALREVPNETTGVAPFMLVFGHLPKGPLAILKEHWSGETDLPLDFGKSTTKYLADLRDKLETAQSYATSHTQRAQSRYANHYNLRSKDKCFDVGDQVLILMPDTTASKTFSRWKGPATVVEKKSPHSYIVEINDAQQHIHANHL